jgi:uncharacterized protein YybS (DUF2232 family)
MGLSGKELALDSIKGGVLTLVLFLAYVTFPVFGLIPGLFAPLPAIFYFFRSGILTGSTIVAITVIALAVMGEPTVPLLYILQSGLISLLLPFFYLQGKGTARAIVYAVGIDFLLIVALAIAYGFWSGVDIQDSMMKGIETSISQAIAVYEKQGVKGDDIKMLTEGMRQAGILIGRIFPSLLLVALGSIASLNLMVLFKMPVRLLPDLPRGEDFRTFKNPEPLVWVVIASGFAMLLPVPEVTRVAFNLLVVTGFVYFLQGLAVLLALFQRMAVPAFARIFFWLFLAFQPYLVLAIAVLGIFDIWGNFRAPKEKNL